MSLKRWKVIVSYAEERVERDVFYIEELEELQDLIEQGHDWRFINKISIRLNNEGLTK